MLSETYQRFIDKLSYNQKGQIILNQPSLYSFMHENRPGLVQIVSRRFRGENVKFGRLVIFLGILPYSLGGGLERRTAAMQRINTVLLSHRPYLIGVNRRQMVVLVYEELFPPVPASLLTLIQLSAFGLYMARQDIRFLERLLTSPGRYVQRIPSSHTTRRQKR